MGDVFLKLFNVSVLPAGSYWQFMHQAVLSKNSNG